MRLPRFSEDGPPVSATTDFGRLFTREDFQVHADHEMLPMETPGWRERHEELRERFGGFVKDYLLRLRAEGLLRPMEGGEGHEVRFLDAWNAMVEDAFEPAPGARRREFWVNWNTVLEPFTHSLIFDAHYPAEKAAEKGEDPKPLLDEGYADLVARMNHGNFDYRDSRAGRDYVCGKTDERYSLDIKAWHPRLGTGFREFVPIQPIAAMPVQELEVEFRTPRLLIADVFRVADFNDLVDVRDYSRPSINSAAGRVLSTETTLARHGFLEIHSTRSPHVLAMDGTLVFGLVDEDALWADEPEDAVYGEDEPERLPEGTEKLGYVSTGRWSVTIVERARMVEILAEKHGAEEAERLVADYLASDDGQDVVQVDVEPGVYHAYFHGETEEFGEIFRSPDLPMPKALEPLFVLSPRKLSLEAEAELAAGPRP